MRDAILEIVRRKMRSLIVIAMLVLVTVALFIAVDGYQMPVIEAARMKWSDLRRQVALAGRGDITSTYKRGKIDLETLGGRIPSKRNFPRLLENILEQAVSSGVTTGPITYKPSLLKDEGLLVYRLAMSVNGRYAAIKSFLVDLRRFRELVVVDDFSLTNSDVFEENVTMDLHMTIYLRGDA